MTTRDWENGAQHQADAAAAVQAAPVAGEPVVVVGQRAFGAAALGRSVGNRRLARMAAPEQVLARDPLAAEASPPPVLTGPFGMEITTPEQLGAYFKLGALSVQQDLKNVQSGDLSASLEERTQEFVDTVTAWGEYYAASKQTSLSAADISVARGLLEEEGAKLRDDLAYAADEPKRREIRRAAEKMRQIAAEAERLAPVLADSARAAFKSGDDDLLSSIADITGNITDIGLGIHELARDLAEEVAHARGVDLPAVGKYVQALDKLNKGLAIINLALSLKGEKGKTDLDEGLRQVGIAAGAFSALGTIVGLSAHIGLYSNLYLVPLTKACIAGVQRIAEYQHEDNKSWVELIGEPANYFVEPGGKPMWQFMVAVMKAEKFTDVPTPSDEVAEYFVDHADSFNAGVKGDDVPVEGWVWSSLNKESFRSWVYFKRQAVWAMLYGSMKVPGR